MDVIAQPQDWREVSHLFTHHHVSAWKQSAGGIIRRYFPFPNETLMRLFSHIFKFSHGSSQFPVSLQSLSTCEAFSSCIFTQREKLIGTSRCSLTESLSAVFSVAKDVFNVIRILAKHHLNHHPTECPWKSIKECPFIWILLNSLSVRL